MKFINIHTHHPTRNKKHIEVVNYFPGDAIDVELLGTVGLHPWSIRDSGNEKLIDKVKSSLESKNIIALGEIGLDRVAKTDLTLQIKIFEKQLNLAEEFQIPVIIHCVKAFSDILEIKKQRNEITAWIFHGFNGSLQIADELLKHGCFLSIGKAILSEKSKIARFFFELPLDKIFLETDDDSDLSIEEVYRKVAVLLGIPIEKLQKQIISNFNNLFPNVL